MTLTVLRYTGQVKCRLPHSETLAYIFLMLDCGCGFWGKGSQSLSAIFITLYQGYLLSHLMTGDINLDLLAEEICVRFLLFKKNFYHERGSKIGILTTSWIITKGNERETSIGWNFLDQEDLISGLMT